MTQANRYLGQWKGQTIPFGHKVELYFALKGTLWTLPRGWLRNVDPNRTLAYSSWIPMKDILGSLLYLWPEYMWSTCFWVLNDMGIARVNEIALTNACFTLQALTLKFNEQPGLRSSNGVTNNDMSICRTGPKHTSHVPDNSAKMLLLKLAGGLKGTPRESIARSRVTMET